MVDFVDDQEIEEVIEEKGYADIDRVEEEFNGGLDVDNITDCSYIESNNSNLRLMSIVLLCVVVVSLVFSVLQYFNSDIPFKDQVTVDTNQVVDVIKNKLKLSDKDMEEIVNVAEGYGVDVDDICTQNEFAIIFNVALTKVDSEVLKGNYRIDYDKVDGSSYERLAGYVSLYNKYIAELHSDDRQVTRQFLIDVFGSDNLQLSKSKASTKDTFNQIDMRSQNEEDTDSEE